MKICIGSDHAGYDYKVEIIDLLTSLDIEVQDVGPFSTDSVDYPDFAHPVANAVESNLVDFGIVICGTGNGVAMTVNKHKGIRCGLAWSEEIAFLTRLHNDANILAIPARFVSLNVALGIVRKFISTSFEGGRHQSRLDKMIDF